MAEEATGKPSSPRCRFPGGKCLNPVPELDLEDGMALTVFALNHRLKGWKFTVAPMTGERRRESLDICAAESVARSLGVPWSEELLERLAACSDVILEQDQKNRPVPPAGGADGKV